MQLHLIRHPQPAIEPGVCYGHSDLALMPNAGAPVLAALLRRLPQGIPVFSSPLQRCTALAVPLARALRSAAPHEDARLMEMDFGAWEMQPWDVIARADIDAWAANLVGYRPGGGESLEAMAARIIAFLRELPALLGQARQAVIVCHAGSMRMILEYSPGIDAADLAELTASKLAQRQIAYGECLPYVLALT